MHNSILKNELLANPLCYRLMSSLVTYFHFIGFTTLLFTALPLQPSRPLLHTPHKAMTWADNKTIEPRACRNSWNIP